MATLIPALGTCLSRMTSGEKRLAERLEHKLDDDYLLWYDVPVGPKQSHPDFVILHPRRSLLILETRDGKLETVQRATKQMWEIAPDGQVKVVINPLAQARHCAIQVVKALERDAQRVQAGGAHQGKLALPWGHGVVFTRITRRQFEMAGLVEAIEPHCVVCSDEMTESAGPEQFQQRLWAMFPHAFGNVMSLPQLHRVRWIMFPEVRVPVSGDLFGAADEAADLPSIMRVMDIQQEQLARSLGDGHRVIHGVAGSGKTMPLAKQLARVMAAKGMADRVHAVHFHKWCRDQLVAFGQTLPANNQSVKDKMADMVLRVISGVERKQIPSGQYQAVPIDEGHGFEPEWLKFTTQMVDPATNSLLVLYDDAQSICERSRSKQFGFKSVGIQAQGPPTILKINHRNTRQILQTASLVAAALLTAEDKDEDGIPMLKPVSCGRDGTNKTTGPLIIRLPSLRAEATRVAELLGSAHCTRRTGQATPGATWPSSAGTTARWTNAPACCASAACRTR